MVLNHSVGPSSVETQAEISLYIGIISLIRQYIYIYIYDSKSLDVVQSLYFGSKLPSS